MVQWEERLSGFAFKNAPAVGSMFTLHSERSDGCFACSPAERAPPAQLAVGATVNILDWKLVFGSGAFSRMFAAANC